MALEIVLTILATVISGIVLILVKGLISHVKTQITMVLQEVELTRIDVNAMDYAVEKSLPKNGYSEYRSDKKKELLDNSKFIHK